MFDLAISNIAWIEQEDENVYLMMKKLGFTGLEIAPTRIFPIHPYDHIEEACQWAKTLHKRLGFTIPSIQSIWYGKNEKIFGTDNERAELVSYTKKAIDFAQAIGCKNLIFGCPQNRMLPHEADLNVAIEFFRELGEYAYRNHTFIAIEANPSIYNTNFLNTTEEAINFIEKVHSKGVLLNLDTGTMIYNNEDISVLIGKVHLISHVHISEPGLKNIQERNLYGDLNDLLLNHYSNYISIELGRDVGVSKLEECMRYVKGVFH